jgi:hypothetical protein
LWSFWGTKGEFGWNRLEKRTLVMMGDVAATLEENSAKTSLIISRFVYSTMLIEENLVIKKMEIYRYKTAKTTFLISRFVYSRMLIEGNLVSSVVNFGCTTHIHHLWSS